MNRNIKLLYGFSFFDQFMIVIALWVPYLATQGIGMRQFMALQAVFAIVILCSELRGALGPVGQEEDTAAGLRGLPLLPPQADQVIQ